MLRHPAPRRPLVVALAALALGCAPAVASACDLTLQRFNKAPQPATLETLPAGVTTVQLDCGGDPRAAMVWTLIVDQHAPRLGVRDEPLFEDSRTGPLVERASAQVGDAARLSVMVREQETHPLQIALGSKRRPFRTFGTVCDAAPGQSKLDCWTGNRRIKMRADARDGDLDAELDLTFHEISVYDGADRLQVISFTTPYRDAPMHVAADWAEMLLALNLAPPAPERVAVD